MPSTKDEKFLNDVGRVGGKMVKCLSGESNPVIAESITAVTTFFIDETSGSNFANAFAAHTAMSDRILSHLRRKHGDAAHELYRAATEEDKAARVNALLMSFQIAASEKPYDVVASALATFIADLASESGDRPKSMEWLETIFRDIRNHIQMVTKGDERAN